MHADEYTSMEVQHAHTQIVSLMESRHVPHTCMEMNKKNLFYLSHHQHTSMEGQHASMAVQHTSMEV